MGLAISRSSALSTNVLLIFDLHDLNGALFYSSFLFVQLFKALPILCFTAICASLQLHKSDLRIGVVFMLT